MTDRTGICAVCGESFPLTKSWRKYCSAKCGRKGSPSAAMVTVTCCICGEPMQQRERYAGKRDPICSETCSSELKRRRQSAPRSELPADHPARWILGQQSSPLRYYECADCGRQACYDARYPSARRCSDCRLRKKRQEGRLIRHLSRFIAGTCARCGQAFIADRQTGASVQPEGGPFCSERCKKRSASSRRRARRVNAYVEDVSPAYVYRRDGYKCQICGKRLAMTKTAPHPKAPTIDHVIPLAQGGTHERNNVQAAHFLCNSLKSDRAAGDQLTLVG